MATEIQKLMPKIWCAQIIGRMYADASGSLKEGKKGRFNQRERVYGHGSIFVTVK